MLDGVARCKGRIVVHTGSWRHDLDQARCLPTQPGLKVQVRCALAHPGAAGRLKLVGHRGGLAGVQESVGDG